MWIFHNLWRALAALAGLAAGVLYFLYRVADAEKGRAQAKADREQAKRGGVEATQAKERAVDESVNQERQRAQEVERENREREDSSDRPDRFGDDRLK